MLCANRLLLILPFVLGSISALNLRDAPIVASSPSFYLDNLTWTATEASLGVSIPATVPGDIISDLQNAGVIGDPYYELNFLDNSTLWSPNSTRWVYSTNVTLPPPDAPAGSSLLLVFEGIKMGARVSLNGVFLGNATNQFVRYTFPIPANMIIPGGSNRVEVAFDAAISTKGRYMACSGGWDWAPLTELSMNDDEFGNMSIMSLGIWKSVYVAAVAPTGPPAITALVTSIKYQGVYPVGALVDGAHGGFSVMVVTHVWAPAGGLSGALTVSGDWGTSLTSPLTAFPAGDSNMTLTLPATASQIKLWWPNGLGAQPLFNVSASWLGSGNGAAFRRIGFRVAALVTVNDTNATVVEESEGLSGSGSGFGMFFRVNGAAIYARGGNLVPMEELEGRLNAQAYATLVNSAADANMNIMRVWGGGIYPPDVFYDTCDERGILLYHDLQFARGNLPQPLSDTAKASLLAEVAHQSRRLSAHPALILYDSNNEDVVQPTGPSALFSSLIMTALAQEDPSRILWPNSPSAGWKSGVHRLWGTPDGTPLVAMGGGHSWVAGKEEHRFYQAGVGAWNWSTIIRDPWSQAHTFDPMLPPGVSVSPASAYGPGAPSSFVSEFGSSSMSSFESMSGTLAQSSWGLHGGDKPSNCTPDSGSFYNKCSGRNAMAQRNWAADNLVWSYFGPALLNASGEVGFKGGLFQSMIAAALNMQSVVESHRSGNYLGAIEWQLNEIWPTGGWGSLEYGSTSSPGSLQGGRWKPMHYWFKNHIFADVMAACGFPYRSKSLACFVSNQRPGVTFSGTLTLTKVDLASGVSSVWDELPISVPAGPGAVFWVTPNATMPNVTTTLLVAKLLEDGATVPFDEHVMHLTAPVNLNVTKATVTTSLASAPNADGSVNITVVSDAVALFVTLTSMAPGRFSDNAFLLLPSTPRLIVWTAFLDGDAPSDYALLKASLRVEDLSTYVQM